MSSDRQDISTDQTEQLVIFLLANEFYGVDIGAVNTIIRMQEITEIPQTPEFVEGVIHLRGSIIPVIDLRKRFGLPADPDVAETPASRRASRIVVVESGGQVIGMVVDAVLETLRLSADAIEPPSPVIASINAGYFRAVGKHDNRLIILLDLDNVITDKQSKPEEAKAA